MMRRLSVIFAFTLFLFSCQKTADEITPETIYSEEQFKNILIDFHLAEGIVTQTVAITDSLNFLSIHTYNEIFEKHHTTKKIFQENLNYYSARTDDFIRVMEGVVDSLNALNLSVMPR